MNKSEVLERISLVRKVHESNLHKALLLADGQPLEGDPLTLNEKAFAFDKLPGVDEAAIKKIVGPAFFSEFEALRKRWREGYCRVYNLYYHHEKGLVSKLLVGKPKLTEVELEHAGAYSAELKEATCRLLHLLEMIEKRIVNLREEAF